MRKRLQNLIKEALKSLNLGSVDFVVEHPTDLKFGDYSFHLKGKDHLLHQDIVVHLNSNKPSYVEKVMGAGGGFINFYLSKEFFKESLGEIIEKGDEFGKNENLSGEKMIIEYTNTNVLKEMHIGHLIGNVIGESLSRIFESSGAEVKRVNYEGDVGLHVAKAVWGIIKQGGKKEGNLSERVAYIGGAYALGSNSYENDKNTQKEIQDINQSIYEGKDENLKSIYEWGKKVSLAYFEELYKILGTRFDYYFFESEVAESAVSIAREFLSKGVFEESDGAIVFKGENYDSKLHTRVFITKQGLPTYEAKDIAHAIRKDETYRADRSIVITANEQNEYFRVVLRALEEVNKEVASKTEHIGHGMLRLPSGKMSSRTGNVITAEALIEEVKKKVKGDEAVAIGAIKYMILRQAIGNDIIFDIDKSVSTEGDSVIYLQYAYARTNSLLEKAD
ncbi:MAG: arginine--tRNA ligase, partial [Patescibacteria group bacterium]|nr:arginine--tRNA ligase [Patescibacteria group bacterium]